MVVGLCTFPAESAQRERSRADARSSINSRPCRPVPGTRDAEFTALLGFVGQPLADTAPQPVDPFQDRVAAMLANLTQSRRAAARLDVDASTDAIEKAFAAAAGDPAALRFQPWVFKGFTAFDRREFKQCLIVASTGREQARELGTPWADGFYDAASSVASLRLGELSDSAAFAESARQSSRAYGVETIGPIASGLGAIAAAHFGDIDTAAALAAEARELIDRSGASGYGLAEVALAESLVMYCRGQGAGALRYIVLSMTVVASVAPFVAEVLVSDAAAIGASLGDRTWTAAVLDLLTITERAWSTPWRRAALEIVRAVHERRGAAPELHALAEQVEESYDRVALMLVIDTFVEARSPRRTATARAVAGLGVCWRLVDNRGVGPVSRRPGRPVKTQRIGWGALTTTERLVCEHLVPGATNRRIGRELGVGERTIETHLASIRRKLEIESRVQLVVELMSRRSC